MGGVVLVEADSADHWSSPPRRTADWAAILSRLSSLSIRRRNLRRRRHSTRVRLAGQFKEAVFYFFPWKFARPLQECPGLGRLQRGGCWELGCVLDQGLNFPSEDEEKGLWHAPMRVSPAL